jgi:hypothetical protein
VKSIEYRSPPRIAIEATTAKTAMDEIANAMRRHRMKG